LVYVLKGLSLPCLFFFQAEDGIRDRNVTGVQTCALPIWRAYTRWLGLVVTSVAQALYVNGYRRSDASEEMDSWDFWQANRMDSQIGRASCRGRGWTSVLAVGKE